MKKIVERINDPAQIKDEVMSEVKYTEAKTLFVKNLPTDVNEAELLELFVTVTEIRLLKKANGVCRGKGFVEMNTEKEAESARGKKWVLRSGFFRYLKFLGEILQNWYI